MNGFKIFLCCREAKEKAIESNQLECKGLKKDLKVIKVLQNEFTVEASFV